MHQVEIISNKMEYYQHSNEDWSKFLDQCKRAINKIHGFTVSVKYDFWSTYMNSCIIDGKRDERTYWDILKETGSLSINDGCLCIDFQFYSHVYAGFSASYYIEQGILTKEQFEDYLKTI
jgi:hypothetical protein